MLFCFIYFYKIEYAFTGEPVRLCGLCLFFCRFAGCDCYLLRFFAPSFFFDFIQPFQEQRQYGDHGSSDHETGSYHYDILKHRSGIIRLHVDANNIKRVRTFPLGIDDICGLHLGSAVCVRETLTGDVGCFLNEKSGDPLIPLALLFIYHPFLFREGLRDEEALLPCSYAVCVYKPAWK